jgi:DNA-directed RNA polymerase specialized sigma subunit
MNTKQKDMELWETYKATQLPVDRDAVLKHMDPLVQRQVKKWAGNVPKATLTAQARLLAAKGLDTYDPAKGTALSTHVVNSMAPLSRTVYTYQNTARIPENITLKLNAFTAAKDHLVTSLGRDPNLEELHQELGWSVNELNRLENYVRKDLVESVGGLNADFHSSNGTTEDDALAAIYFSLTPAEKNLFEYTTGYNGKPVLDNTGLIKQLGLSQAQVSYQKSLLKDKIKRFRQGAR